MPKIFITRNIPEAGLKLLRDKGYSLTISPTKVPLPKKQLLKELKKNRYDAVLSLLTDTIDKEVFDSAPTVKMYANYAVGFNNIDVKEAIARGIKISNTPGALSVAVAEHTIALMMAVTRRIVESDSFMRNGKYKGWDPMIFLGREMAGLTLGIIGTGRIGVEVAHRASKGLGMTVVYYDVVRNEQLEKEYGATFRATPEEVLSEADIISLHVPLLPTTTHLINASRLALMKRDAIIINTARGPVIDEEALVSALKAGKIAGAGLDVFEMEPKLAKGLTKLPNVILTPHTASATQKARDEMATLAASNLIAFFEGKPLPNSVQ